MLIRRAPCLIQMIWQLHDSPYAFSMPGWYSCPVYCSAVSRAGIAPRLPLLGLRSGCGRPCCPLPDPRRASKQAARRLFPRAAQVSLFKYSMIHVSPKHDACRHRKSKRETVRHCLFQATEVKLPGYLAKIKENFRNYLQKLPVLLTAKRDGTQFA